MIRFVWLFFILIPLSVHADFKSNLLVKGDSSGDIITTNYTWKRNFCSNSGFIDFFSQKPKDYHFRSETRCAIPTLPLSFANEVTGSRHKARSITGLSLDVTQIMPITGFASLHLTEYATNTAERNYTKLSWHTKPFRIGTTSVTHSGFATRARTGAKMIRTHTWFSLSHIPRLATGFEIGREYHKTRFLLSLRYTF